MVAPRILGGGIVSGAGDDAGDEEGEGREGGEGGYGEGGGHSSPPERAENVFSSAILADFGNGAVRIWKPTMRRARKTGRPKLAGHLGKPRCLSKRGQPFHRAPLHRSLSRSLIRSLGASPQHRRLGQGGWRAGLVLGHAARPVAPETGVISAMQFLICVMLPVVAGSGNGLEACGVVEYIDEPFVVDIRRETAFLTWPDGRKMAVPLNIFRQQYIRAGNAIVAHDGARPKLCSSTRDREEIMPPRAAGTARCAPASPCLHPRGRR